MVPLPPRFPRWLNQPKHFPTNHQLVLSPFFLLHPPEHESGERNMGDIDSNVVEALQCAGSMPEIGRSSSLDMNNVNGLSELVRQTT